MRLWWILAVLVASLPGCASITPKLPARPASADEVKRLTEAMTPLLETLAIPRLDDCRLGIVVIDSGVINAAIAGRREGPPCTLFTVAATQGMLRKFPVSMLRAALAHELAHWLLGHVQERADRSAAAVIFAPVTRAFDRQQEFEADRLAVDILRRLEPRYPGSCMALVYAFALLAQQPAGSGWLADHPSPDQRAERALDGCNGTSTPLPR